MRPLEVRKSCLRTVYLAHEVHLHDAPDVVDRCLLESTVQGDSSGVQPRIDTPELGDGAVRQATHVLQHGDIGYDGDSLPTISCD